DNLLDPIRISDSVLKDNRLDLGEYGYAGQFDQDPAPSDGGVWKRWIKPIDDYLLDQMLAEGKIKKIGSDWDLAYTEKETNSASAYVTSGEYDGNMYITDMGFDWLEFPKLMDYMKSKKPVHYIEAKGCFTYETLVRTSKGLKKIGNIKPNELVLSFNEKTEILEYKKVLRTFSFTSAQYSNKLCIFELNNGSI